MPIRKIKGAIQIYECRGTEFLLNLLGKSNNGVRCAEYWMGAHDSAPSQVEIEGVNLKGI
ncbi:mannose-6-phosphate isomerase [Reichenbachiella faecimaris]|uniref:Mannose-6-phosphate isomerase n=1 Tax=Reichenbachiella faecimaris TaxID=692418 RepID=A0A1W2G832_REIFA|nr:hypothetical protein [Reichenbachiella faecimaris]SMD32827.1 mannose-6-phosphate isomerase [Reichenbachiella faecimaris]